MTENNRKLIGTIVGVIFFVMLIAGATFAWLTYTANVNNGIYNTSTMNFFVNYQGGNDITSLPMLSGNVGCNDYINTGANPITVRALKENLPGTLYLKLHIDENNQDNLDLLEAECIKYVVKNDTVCLTSSTFNEINTITEDDLDENNDIVIYEGPLPEIVDPRDSATAGYYRIYFWIDSESVTSNEIGMSFSGYVHAYAVQSELGNTSSGDK